MMDSTTAATAPGLVDLPTETLFAIAEYVPDLSALSGTCRRLRDISTPQLFRTMTIHFKNGKDNERNEKQEYHGRDVQRMLRDARDKDFMGSDIFRYTKELRIFVPSIKETKATDLEIFATDVLPALMDSLDNLKDLDIKVDLDMQDLSDTDAPCLTEFFARLFDYSGSLETSVRLWGIMEETFWPCFQDARAICMLELAGVGFTDVFHQNLAEMISRCPELQHLCLRFQDLEFERVLSYIPEEDMPLCIVNLELSSGTPPYSLANLERLRYLKRFSTSHLAHTLHSSMEKQVQMWSGFHEMDISLDSLELDTINTAVLGYLKCSTHSSDLTYLKLALPIHSTDMFLDIEDLGAVAKDFRKVVLPKLLPQLKRLYIGLTYFHYLAFRGDDDSCHIEAIIDMFSARKLFKNLPGIAVDKLEEVVLMERITDSSIEATLQDIADFLPQAPRLSNITLYLMTRITDSGDSLPTVYQKAMEIVQSWTPSNGLASGVELHVLVREPKVRYHDPETDWNMPDHLDIRVPMTDTLSGQVERLSDGFFVSEGGRWEPASSAN